VTAPLETNPHFDLVRAWFDARGASGDHTPDLEEELDQRQLDDVEYYFGEPTCAVDDHVLEVAGLVSLDKVYEPDVFERYRPGGGRAHGHTFSVEHVTSPQPAVWVARRFTEHDLADGIFDTHMEELIDIVVALRHDLGVSDH
jgi:hypothetical protein